MKCYHCNTTLIWGSDETDEDDDRFMHTYLSCPNCPTTVTITHQTHDEEAPPTSSDSTPACTARP